MPENSTGKSSSSNGDHRNGPPPLRGRVARGLPSPVVAACLASAALGLAACAGPASTRALPASAGTVSARSAAPTTAPPAPSASATGSSATAAPATQPSPSQAPSQTPPGSANPAIPLAPSQLPAFNVEAWTEQKAGPVDHVTGHNIGLNECATVHGAATWQQQTYVSSSGGDSAIFETYTFGTAAAARSAYAAASAGMKSCQATSRALQVANHITPDAVTHQTASETDAAAFERVWTGVDGISAFGPQTNHLYLAVRGTTLVVLHFDEFGKHPAAYDVRNDPAVLATLIGVLTR
jgi:hypothetical protein